MIWCAILFCIGAKAKTDSIEGFTVSGLKLYIEYDDNMVTKPAVSATENSATVTTVAKESSSGSGCNAKYTYSKQKSTLQIENPTEDALEVTYVVTAGKENVGSLEDVSVDTENTVIIPAKGKNSIVTMVSGERKEGNSQASSPCFPAVFMLTVTKIEKVTVKTSVIFENVELVNGKTPGSYTVKTGNTLLELNKTYTNDINT